MPASIDPQNRLYLMDGELYFAGMKSGERIFPSLPLTQEVTGITLKGFKYPLENKDICIGTSLCISNGTHRRRGTDYLFRGRSDGGGIS